MSVVENGSKVTYTLDDLIIHPLFETLDRRAQDETGTIFGASLVEMNIDRSTGEVTTEAWNGTDLVSGPSLQLKYDEFL